jgi:hypothetical protein
MLNMYFVCFYFQHGTCPVCRKDLSGEDTSLKDNITPILDDDDDSPINNDPSNGMT